MSGRYSSFFAVLLTGLLLSTFSIVDATTFNSPIRITTNTYWSGFPSVAASGSYVYVAWEDYTPVTGSGTAPEIWMRVSPISGGSFGSPVRISTNTGLSDYPSVAASESYVYVAWQDSTPVSGSGSASEIWMRVSANNGASFGSPVRISTNTGKSVSPSIATSGGDLYVVWMDDTPVTGSGAMPEIWLRVSSNYGASFGSAIRISYNVYSSWFPSVATAGPYVYVAWGDWTPVTGSGGLPEIWMRVSSYGGSFGPAIRISYNEYRSLFASVAATGSYLLPVHVYVAWEDSTPVTGSGGKDEIWFRASISA